MPAATLSYAPEAQAKVLTTNYLYNYLYTKHFYHVLHVCVT
jgi:hypothetical protein